MGVLSALAIGGALGAGFLFGRKKKKQDQNTYQLTRPPETQTQLSSSRTPAQRVADTKPVDAVKAESENVSKAQQAARGVRRKALAGSAGRVSTGAASGQQRAIRGAGAAPSLLGY